MKREGTETFVDDDYAEARGLLIEQAASPHLWVLFAAGVALFGGLIALNVPPRKPQEFALVAASTVFAAFCAVVAVWGFKRRHDATRYFRDRVEIHRRGALLHRLAYEDVERVAFAFVPGEHQVLSFGGPGGVPSLTLTLTDAETKVVPSSPYAVTEDKLTALRDLLYEIVGERMLLQIEAGQPAPWFGDVVMTPHGLGVGQTLVPWHEVSVSADESSGAVDLIAGPAGARRTSMIEDNVVPGLLIVQQLRQRLAA